MKTITYIPKEDSLESFISFWSKQYSYPKEHLYNENINNLTESGISHLFEWKNGTTLSDLKRVSVKTNFADKLHELNVLPDNTTAKEFLAHFDKGGAIWRIFWLHCWKQTYPIYDQHVHRAMSFIMTGKNEEIPTKDTDKINSYIEKYIEFHSRFSGLDDRCVDKALWVFGKFLKEFGFKNEYRWLNSF